MSKKSAKEIINPDIKRTKIFCINIRPGRPPPADRLTTLYNLANFNKNKPFLGGLKFKSFAYLVIYNYSNLVFGDIGDVTFAFDNITASRRNSITYVASMVQWLSRLLHTQKVASSILARSIFFVFKILQKQSKFIKNVP